VRAAGLNRADLSMTSGLAYDHAGGQGTIAGLESLSLPIDRVFPLDQVVDARDHMRANRHLGKIVVTV
jgi:NADPH:quinone reductase-like Zn-dependent oxidoreductase